MTTLGRSTGPTRTVQETPRPAQDGPGEPKIHPRAAARRGPEVQKNVKHAVFTMFYAMPKEPPRAHQEAARSCPEATKTPPAPVRGDPKRQEVLRRLSGAAKRPQGDPQDRQDAPKRLQEPPKNASCHDHREVRPRT